MKGPVFKWAWQEFKFCFQSTPIAHSLLQFLIFKLNMIFLSHRHLTEYSSSQKGKSAALECWRLPELGASSRAGKFFLVKQAFPSPVRRSAEPWLGARLPASGNGLSSLPVQAAVCHLESGLRVQKAGMRLAFRRPAGVTHCTSGADLLQRPLLLLWDRKRMSHLCVSAHTLPNFVECLLWAEHPAWCQGNSLSILPAAFNQLPV